MKHVFIINPTLKKDKLLRIKQEIDKNFIGQNVILEKTKGPGHAELIAKKYAMFENEPTRLYVCGGDGLLHETVNGIIGGQDIELVILPFGTGNDFVKSFETLQIEDFKTLSNYEDPVHMNCDVMKVNGEYSINTISFGFDVEVAKYANFYKKKLPVKGIVPYNMGLVSTLFSPLGKSYSIQIDENEPFENTFSFVVFCNGKFYGGGYKPRPDAQLNDGIIDCCFIHDVNRRDIMNLAREYKKGTHLKHTDKIVLESGKIIHINTENQTIYGNLDGEVRPIVNPTIEIVSNAVHLVLPNIGD